MKDDIYIDEVDEKILQCYVIARLYKMAIEFINKLINKEDNNE